MKPTIVLGGNLSGLAAAHALSHSEAGPVCVVDKGPEPGGTVRTCVHDGFRFDLGPHVLSESPAQESYKFLDELLGSDIVKVPIRTACLLNGKLWDSQTLSIALDELPFYRRTRIRGRYEVQRIKSRLYERKLSNPRDLCIALFGKEAYVLIVKPYYDKLWGKHGSCGHIPESIKTNCIHRGLANPITGAFDLLDPSSMLTQAPRNEAYPRLGIGDIRARLVQQTTSETEWITGAHIEAVEWNGNEITSVTINRNGDTQKLEGGQYLCSLLPEELIPKMVPVPESVVDVAAPPVYRSMIY
ncbi:MAG TPA: NAD(P)-binding protein, partial [Terriglobia bacterium]|nr:NAD(P)-binding protein [Terriglobia bacterium]